MGFFTFLLDNNGKKVVHRTSEVDENSNNTVNIKLEDFPGFTNNFSLIQRQKTLDYEVNSLKQTSKDIYKNYLDSRKTILSLNTHINTLHQKLSAEQTITSTLKNRVETQEKAIEKMTSILDKLIEISEHQKAPEQLKPETQVITKVIREKVPLPAYLKDFVVTVRALPKPLPLTDIAIQTEKKRRTARNYLYRLKEYGYKVDMTQKPDGTKVYFVK